MLDLLSWAKRFVATPSVTRDGNRAIADLAAELLGEIGVEPRRQTVELEGVEHCNLIADLGPTAAAAGGLLLVTHLDTVPPGDPAAWTRTAGDPFRPTVVEDRLYGLGSADAKVDFVCKVAALGEIDRDALRRPLRLVGTFAEETGLRGARHLVGSGEAAGFRYALVGEPSELVAVHAHKGYAVFEARLRAGAALRSLRAVPRLEVHEGVSAHSSTPHLGVNAIERAVERLARPDVAGVAALEAGGPIVNKVPDRCELELWCQDADSPPLKAVVHPAAPLVEFLCAWRVLLERLAERTDDRFDPPHTVGNLGSVELREGRLVFRFDLRSIPGVDPKAAVEALEPLAEVTCLRTNPPLWTEPDSALIRALLDAQAAAGLPRRLATKATSTEAGVFSEAGLETVVIGAGLSVGNVHRPNEHTRVPELELAARLYAGLIRRLCIEEPSPCSG
jgi:acetylornithine deacetylase/succinyl-diaminopimelate desuccinylase-like protein